MAGDAAEEGEAVVDAPASPRAVFEDFRAE
jgi:hypothetical protein